MKSLKNIEEKMEGLDKDSLRYHILDSAKNFKTSWVELGRALYSVWKNKLFKEWGYASFDVYTAREIGIRKQTAMKLLRSYYFMENEEPQYLKAAPSYESIDILRMAKGKKAIDDEDYANLKKEIFENGKDPYEVKKNLSALIRERKELEPEEASSKRKLVTVKRLLGTLKSLKKEIELLKLLPAADIKEVSNLINKLEAEIS